MTPTGIWAGRVLMAVIARIEPRREFQIDSK
jgi:hypothetical protein